MRVSSTTLVPLEEERRRSERKRSPGPTDICAAEGGQKWSRCGTADSDRCSRIGPRIRIRSILVHWHHTHVRAFRGFSSRDTATHNQPHTCRVVTSLRVYSPPTNLAINTPKPIHRPYLHPRRPGVAESAAIFYTREHILHCDVGQSASAAERRPLDFVRLRFAAGGDSPFSGGTIRAGSAPEQGRQSRALARERDGSASLMPRHLSTLYL